MRHVKSISRKKKLPAPAQEVRAPCPQPFLIEIANVFLRFFGKDPIIVIVC